MKDALRYLILSIATCDLGGRAMAQTVSYVDDDAPPGGNGQSWASAHKYLQDALAVAPPNVEIRVAGGTYLPDRGAAQVLGSKASTFRWIEGMVLRGGFRGLAGGGDPDEQNVAAFPSTLSADLAGNDPVRSDNAYNVATMAAIAFARVEAFTIRGGGDGLSTAPGAGLVKYSGDLQVSACTFLDNRTANGGAVHAIGGSLSVDGSVFSGNRAGGAGGAINLSGVTAIVNTTLFDQNAGPSNPGGGAVHVSGGTLALNTCQFTGNTCGGDGGAIYSLDCSITLQACQFDANTTTSSAGCIRFRSSTAYMQDCTITNSSSLSLGGAIQLDHQTWLTAVQCSFSNNSVPYSAGGAIFATDSGVDLTDCQFLSNHAGGHGGGLWSDATVLLTRCEFISNHATQGGAGLTLTAIVPTTSVLDGCEFRSNLSNDYAGGMEHTGVAGSALQILNTRFEANVSSRKGGGLWLGGGADSVFLQDCAFVGNQNTLFGGAGLAIVAQPTTVYRCQVSENSTNEQVAAGIRIDSANALVEHCTVVENSVAGTNGSAAGIFGSAANVSVRNSILWANRDQNSSTENDQVGTAGGTLSIDYDCVQGLTGSLGGTGNLGSNPDFWDLASHDYQLRHRSPCVNAGDPASPMDPDGSRTDMGAFTFDPLHCGPPIVYCDSKLNSLGCLPQISGIGSPSASASSGFVVQSNDIRNNKPGLLLYSVSGGDYLPFQGAHLCVAAPIRRSPGVQSGGNAAPADDCSGVLALDFNAFASGALGGTPIAALSAGGTIVYCQWWSRDPGDLYGTSLSNALEFTICP